MDEPIVHPLLAEQQRRNRATRDHWDLFAPHRLRVTDLLIGAIPAHAFAPRLTVLGAGNCNDLDLPRLRQHFAALRLVDWDDDATRLAAATQGLRDDPGVSVFGGIDATGFGAATNGWSPSEPVADGAVRAALSTPGDESWVERVGESEVVVSLCLLSQIFDGIARTLGAGHSLFLEVLQYLRGQHLRLLVQLLVPGGAGLLISDLVSSDTAPQLVDTEDVALPSLLARLIGEGNFFSGLNPAVMHSLLTTGELASVVGEVVPLAPWKWNLGPRTYAVYGFRFRRRVEV